MSRRDGLCRIHDPHGAHARIRGDRSGYIMRVMVPRPDLGDEWPGAERVYVYGYASPNPGPGGWAWVSGKYGSASGYSEETTPARMALMAITDALVAIEGPIVFISTDKMVMRCFLNGWWKRWIENDWIRINSFGVQGPVKNRDLWEPLVQTVAARNHIAFQWPLTQAELNRNDDVRRIAKEELEDHRSQTARRLVR